MWLNVSTVTLNATLQFLVIYRCVFFPINYSMGKISKKNCRDPSKEVQWTSVMDSTLVDAFLHQVNIGGRVNGTFTCI